MGNIMMPLMLLATCLQCALAGYFVGQGYSPWILATLSTAFLGAYVVWRDKTNGDHLISQWRDIAESQITVKE